MATPLKSVESVDARGLVCPMPTIRLGQAIRRVEVGDVVEIVTDDPGSRSNMGAWCRNTGHELVDSSEEAGVYTYRVRRAR